MTEPGGERPEPTVRVDVPEAGVVLTLPASAGPVQVEVEDTPLPWPTAAVGVVIALLLGVALPATEPRALRKDVAGPAEQAPRWVLWPDDHADRVAVDGPSATLVNPPEAGARDGVTACWDAGPPRPGTTQVTITWATTSADPQGLARVFGKVVVPGSMPRITPIATTHDTSPEATGSALLDVPADALAVQTCGSVGGPGMTLQIRVPSPAPADAP